MNPLLAANFGGGGPIDFANIKAAGGNLASNGVGFGIVIFVLMAVIGVVLVMTQGRGKSEVLGWIGVTVLGAVGITAFIAWGTAQANAALF